FSYGLEVDHITPREVSADDSIENLWLLCSTCHDVRKPIIERFWPTDAFHEIKNLKIWWYYERTRLAELVADKKLCDVVKLIHAPQFKQYLVVCNEYESVTKFFKEDLRIDRFMSAREETTLNDAAELFCALAPLLDRCNCLDQAKHYLNFVRRVAQELTLPDQSPLLVNCRLNLIHLYNKSEETKTLREAKRLLSGLDGFIPQSDEDSLNHMKQAFETGEYEEAQRLFMLASHLSGRERSIAEETYGAACLGHAAKRDRSKFVNTPRQQSLLMERARAAFEASFRGAAFQYDPRTLLLRCLNLVEIYALKEVNGLEDLPWLQKHKYPKEAAEARLCAEAFMFGNAGLHRKHATVLTQGYTWDPEVRCHWIDDISRRREEEMLNELSSRAKVNLLPGYGY
ncbi:MAG TPA: HNH endonuclease signature motif containing protein, partial [Nitrososphaera sp.]|nr:HNH endonuclease signature motif containing protein [Nitrososphaera sp.]